MQVVEHAERFGVLQLHQLRGRVGRSAKQSACILTTTSSLSLDRLKTLQVRPRLKQQNTSFFAEMHWFVWVRAWICLYACILTTTSSLSLSRRCVCLCA